MTTARPTQRPVNPWLLVAAFAAYSAAHLANNLFLARGAPERALQALQAWSGGWIEPVLVRSQVVLLVFLGLVVGLGRRSFSELGWRARDVVPGLALYLGAWLALQLGLVAAVLRQGVELAWHPLWTRFGVGAVLGGVLSQALGHALVEDTAFRGFFLPELRRRFARAGSALAVLLCILFAVAGSALLFGLAHLPTRLLVKGSGLAELLREQGNFLLAGLALGLAAVATRNLFAVVGLHVLLNDPAPLVAVPGEVLNRAVLVVFAGVVVLAAVRGRRRQAMAEAVAEGRDTKDRRAA